MENLTEKWPLFLPGRAASHEQLISTRPHSDGKLNKAGVFLSIIIKKWKFGVIKGLLNVEAL